MLSSVGTGLYEPSQLSDREIASKEASSFLFYSCINHIYQVKTGPFAEHSSCLQSLCEIPHWEKVNSGMIKMYKGEVSVSVFMYLVYCVYIAYSFLGSWQIPHHSTLSVREYASIRTSTRHCCRHLSNGTFATNQQISFFRY